MTREKYLDLIHREIDGANTPKETAKVKAYLAKDPRAQKLYNDLVAVSNMLSKASVIKPSPNLRKIILNSIPSGKYAVGKSRSPLKLVLNTLFVGYKVQYAYAFAAGLIFGVVVYSFFITDKNSSSEISTLYGTMLSREASASLETADHSKINLDQVTGTVATKYSRGLIVVELNLRAEPGLEIVIEYDENDLGFGGFGQSEDARNTIIVDKNRVRLTSLDENSYILIFRDKTESVTPINVKIFSSDALVYEEALSTGQMSK